MDPIATLPALHEDETVASFCARAVTFGCYRDAVLFGALFGAASRRPDPLLPRGLLALSQILAAVDGPGNEDAWLHGHTHFNYFASTASRSRGERLAKRMLAAGLGALRPVRALTAQEWFDRAVRFCPECRLEQVRRIGYFYTRRVHVTPYVRHCLAHGIELATEDGALPRTSSKDPSQMSLRFARLSCELLAGPPGSRRERLGRQLDEIVPPTLPHVKRTSSLGTLFVDRFATAFDGSALTSVVADPSVACRMAARALSRRSQAVHPVITVLVEMLHQAGVAVSGRQSKQSRVEPVQSHAEVLKCVRDRIACGVAPSIVARELGVSAHTALTVARAAGLTVGRRPKRLLRPLVLKIEEQLSQGHHPTHIARDLGLSAVTVYRQLASNPELAARRRTALRSKQRQDCRSRWQALLRASPTTGIQEARAAEPALYAWLYRNDRCWLRCALAPHRRKRDAIAERPRIPTGQMVAALAAAASRLRAHPDRPLRITWARLLIEAGIRRHLPLASFSEQSSVAGSLDTTATFVERRLRWAIEQLLARQQPLNLWRVQKMCGLRPSTLLESGVDIERAILEYIEGRRPFAMHVDPSQ